MTELKAQLKRTLVTELNLEDIAPEDIASMRPVRDGLGMDSLDAVEMSCCAARLWRGNPNMDEGRQAFQSISARPN
jgi:acyl carrier protein